MKKISLLLFLILYNFNSLNADNIDCPCDSSWKFSDDSYESNSYRGQSPP